MVGIMKIAIPLFQDRVSPRFDTSPVFLLSLVENGLVIKQEEFYAEPWLLRERVRKLKEMGVNALICGGIDPVSSQQLMLNEIKIYSWVTGLAQDALQSLLKGRLKSCAMIGPGGRCRGIWRLKRCDSGGECEPGGRRKARGPGPSRLRGYF
jgi:predicted Fe-Mo cluster-binding NifX family protein